MLTEQEKQKIVFEEKYRNEIRQQLETKSSNKLNIFKFLNSNFGAFLLSTVIVGGISFLYNSHQENLKKIEKQQVELQLNEAKKRKLYTELAHRLTTIKTIKDPLVAYRSKDIYLAYHGSTIGNDPKINATYYNFKSYYPEYAEFSILKLLDELMITDTVRDYSKLKNELVNVTPDIIDIGQNWFYQINSKTKLPKGVKINFNKIQNTYYYRIDGKLNILDRKDTFQKLFFIGESDKTKTLVTTIEEVLQDKQL